MAKQIFINLPVKDLQKSISFFTKLGFSFNPRFTDENATCMIVAEDIFVMLLVESFFKGFSEQEICDVTKANEVILCLSLDSKQEVYNLYAEALNAGGKKQKEPQDHGFMILNSFKDLDGHIWEITHMSGLPPIQEG